MSAGQSSLQASCLHSSLNFVQLRLYADVVILDLQEESNLQGPSDKTEQACSNKLATSLQQACLLKSMSPSAFCYQKFLRIGSYERTIRALGNVNLTTTGFGERSHSDLKQAYPNTNKHGSREVDSQASPSNKHYHASTHVVPTLHAYSCTCNLEPPPYLPVYFGVHSPYACCHHACLHQLHLCRVCFVPYFRNNSAQSSTRQALHTFDIQPALLTYFHAHSLLCWSSAWGGTSKHRALLPSDRMLP